MEGDCVICGGRCVDCKCPIIREIKWMSKEEALEMWPDECIEFKEFTEKHLGIDPETIEGDYSEAYQHMYKALKQTEIDKRFK